MFKALDTFAATDPWAAMRRAPRHTDEALTGTARRWLRRLPARRRPLRLCHDYPRVANLLAAHWDDIAQTQRLLDDLLTDRRGGRRGFPVPVARELRRLLEFNDQCRLEIRPEAVGEVLRRLAAW